MRKINTEAFESLMGKDKGRELNPQLKEITDLGIGEGLLIFKNEWTMKNNPFQSIRVHAIKSKKKFTQKTLADGSGWAIIRGE